MKTRLIMAERGAPEESWCRSYAETSLKLKHGDSQSQRARRMCADGIKKAFGMIYRAVAFDIDGTLTKSNSTQIDFRMA